MPINVCVQGLGFVGAAMATALASKVDADGNAIFNAIGLDLATETGKNRVDRINNGIFPFESTDTHLIDEFRKAHLRGNLKATHNERVLQNVDVVVVDVNLDLNFEGYEPSVDFNNFQNAIATVGKNIRPETLVLIETTVPPGTCERVVLPILQKHFTDRGISASKVSLAHSYERVMPGDNYLTSITSMWRTYSGIDENSRNKCRSFLSNLIDTRVFPLTELSTLRSSEIAKVLENSYRATNIAFMHEWTKFSHAAGIDLFEVLKAIRVRPTHSNIRYPGVGVGGYCLTKDPEFIKVSAKQFFQYDSDFPFVDLTRATFSEMPAYAVHFMYKHLPKPIHECRILLFGVTYREDVSDTRYSPVEHLVSRLLASNCSLRLIDPLVSYWSELELSIEQEVPTRFDSDEIVVIAVNHKAFRVLHNYLLGSSRALLVIDLCNFFSKEEVKSLQNRGLQVFSLGRGDLK